MEDHVDRCSDSNLMIFITLTVKGNTLIVALIEGTTHTPPNGYIGTLTSEAS